MSQPVCIAWQGSAGLDRESTRWRRFCLPSFSDLFFVAVLVWLFVVGAGGWNALLMDGDTGWHIRTGEYIIDHWRIPTHDIYSFTRAGAPWFAWEWLSDVTFGILHRCAGLKGIVLFAGILIATFATVLLRFSLWRGANVIIALPLTLLAVGSSTIHFLARPHLFTLVLLPVSLWILERDRCKSGTAVWVLVPLTALWTNLHGGFAIFLACFGVVVFGIAIEQWRGGREWGQVRRYGAVLAACCAATLVNPFGVNLPVHILGYLSADWIRNLVQEFQAPTFRSEGQIQFELLLVAGLMIAARLGSKGRIADALLIVFLAHSALTSVRHAPLFASVAAPMIAAELTAMWRSAVKNKKSKDVGRILLQLGSDLNPAFRRSTAWVACSIAIVAAVGSPMAWPTDFPKYAFPVEMVHRNAEKLATSRVLTSDQWADYLIYSSYPRQKVFVDGRSDFYGEKMGREYLALMQGQHASGELLDRFHFDLALVPIEWPLAEILKNRRGWTVLEDDGKAILFSAGCSRGLDCRPKSYLAPNEKPHLGRTV